jgi:hypothetical protein
MDEQLNDNIEKDKKGVKVYSIIYQLMFQFLGKSSTIPKEVFCKSKKLNNEYKEKRNMKFNSIYKKMKNAEPVIFNYNKKDLYCIIDYMINTNQKDLLKFLVVPTKYFGYFDQINDEIYNYYLNSFKKLTIEKKIKKFQEFLIKGFNYINVISMLDKIINFSQNIININEREKNKNKQNNENQNQLNQNIQCLENDIENIFPFLNKTENNNNNNITYTPIKNSYEQQALKLKNYLLKNIYGLKKYKFENNYEYFLKERKN